MGAGEGAIVNSLLALVTESRAWEAFYSRLEGLSEHDLVELAWRLGTSPNQACERVLLRLALVSMPLSRAPLLALLARWAQHPGLLSQQGRLRNAAIHMSHRDVALAAYVLGRDVALLRHTCFDGGPLAWVLSDAAASPELVDLRIASALLLSNRRLVPQETEKHGDWSFWAEVRRAERATLKVASVVSPLTSFQDAPTNQSFTRISGVLMPVIGPLQTSREHFIITDTLNGPISQAAQAITACHPLLIEGPRACGKAALVKYIADKTGNTPIRVHVDLVSRQPSAQQDLSALLGSLAPVGGGQFKWQSGPVGIAMEQGRWLLLTGLRQERNPPEVTSLVSQLASIRPGGAEGFLVPGSSYDIPVARGFRLVVSVQGIDSLQSDWKKMFKKVTLQCPRSTDLVRIFRERYPQVDDCAERVERSITTVARIPLQFPRTAIADGLKIMSRLNGLHNRAINRRHLSPETAALEAFDVLVAGESDKELINDATVAIGVVWSVSPALIQSVLTKSKPVVDVGDSATTIGRAMLRSPTGDTRRNLTAMAETSGFLRVLESVARAVEMGEHVLLCGETGTGKTSTMQALAGLMGKELVVINMSQQTDAGHLIGGFRPVELSREIQSLAASFEQAFNITLSQRKNQVFIDSLRQSVVLRDSNRALALMRGLVNSLSVEKKTKGQERRRRWADVEFRLGRIEAKVADIVETKHNNESLERLPKREKRSAGNKIDFEFFPGPLTQAISQGSWILLDELNLAPQDLLEQVASILEDRCIFIQEIGSEVTIHEDFALFGAMNPPTDFGKKALPGSLRRLFTEYYVSDDFDLSDIALIAGRRFYGPRVSQTPAESKRMLEVASVYANLRHLNLIDGSGASFRATLRHLSTMVDHAAGLREHVQSLSSDNRLLFEGGIVAIASALSPSDGETVSNLLATELKLSKNYPPLARLMNSAYRDQCEDIEGFLVERGPEPLPPCSNFVVTPSAKVIITFMARSLALGSRRTPILLQGPTAAGKTSVVRHLSQETGHKLIRINNHEHTDVSEYLGFYVSAEDGSLVFQEGPLIEAAREGHWVVLDELNLAPADVLESLNRLLDDNREIRVPETGVVVKAHPHFALFATQNPPQLYGGRKQLSRALRGRFIELNVPELEDQDLALILKQKYKLPSSFASAMTNVARELERRRQLSNFFRGKEGFLTARDLFRWAARKPRSRDELALHGFYLLGDRARGSDERETVRQVLIRYTGAGPSVLDEAHLYNGASLESCGLAMTPAMKRVLTLLSEATRNREPVLLVGSTGSGKTSACQSLSQHLGLSLCSMNLHRNSEASDFVGSYRPAQKSDDKLFEWVHGPLTNAMIDGSAVLLDELNTADDAVLERLNSVLEEERRISLVEKGNTTSRKVEEIVAADNFRLFATMNPGGDYGKRELSPALRNRFTEIWVPSPRCLQDFSPLLEMRLPGLPLLSGHMAEFCGSSTSVGLDLSLRDASTWAEFIRVALESKVLGESEAYYHGADLTFLDVLRQKGSVWYTKAESLLLDGILESQRPAVIQSLGNLKIDATGSPIMCGPFPLLGSQHSSVPRSFNLSARQTSSNFVRIGRALLLERPILLEGPPGVGKTAVSGCMARLASRQFVRINLSEHTEMSDLLGTEAPTGIPGEFKFQRGALLQAIIDGSWVLLDELNLASQSVLEGLNSLLDHRREVWLPELGQRFKAPPEFRIFGAQNPASSGGGRKSLPCSFLNRFSRVFVAALESSDIHAILNTGFPSLSDEVIAFVVDVLDTVNRSPDIPLSLNLRDAERWCLLVLKSAGTNIMTFFDPIVVQALPRHQREGANRLRKIVENSEQCRPEFKSQQSLIRVANNHVVYGHLEVERGDWCVAGTNLEKLFADGFHQSFAAMICSVVTGDAFVMENCSETVKQFAAVAGKQLVEVELSGSADAVDILGGYENWSPVHLAATVRRQLEDICQKEAYESIRTGNVSKVRQLLQLPFDRDGFELLRHLISAELPLDLLDSKRMETSSDDSSGSFFIWRKSRLLEAILDGHWVLLKGANLCPAAVLDRLNPFLERSYDPVVIAEAPDGLDGKHEVVKPSKHFRLFMSLDPLGPSISPAIQNRSFVVQPPYENSDPLGRLSQLSSSLAIETIPSQIEFDVVLQNDLHGPEIYLLSGNSEEFDARLKKLETFGFQYHLPASQVSGTLPAGAELIGWGPYARPDPNATIVSGMPFALLVLKNIVWGKESSACPSTRAMLTKPVHEFTVALDKLSKSNVQLHLDSFLAVKNVSDLFAYINKSIDPEDPCDSRIMVVLLRKILGNLTRLDGNTSVTLAGTAACTSEIMSSMKTGAVRAGFPFPTSKRSLTIEVELFRVLLAGKYDSMTKKASIFHALACLPSPKSSFLLDSFESLLKASESCMSSELTSQNSYDWVSTTLWNFTLTCLEHRPITAKPELGMVGQRIVDDFVPLCLKRRAILPLVSIQAISWSLTDGSVLRSGFLKEACGRSIGAQIDIVKDGFHGFVRLWKHNDNCRPLKISEIGSVGESKTEMALLSLATIGSRSRHPKHWDIFCRVLEEIRTMHGLGSNDQLELSMGNLGLLDELKTVTGLANSTNDPVTLILATANLCLANWLALADVDPADLASREIAIYEELEKDSRSHIQAIQVLEKVRIGNISGSVLQSNAEIVAAGFRTLSQEAVEAQTPRLTAAPSFEDLRHVVETFRSGLMSHQTISKMLTAAKTSSASEFKLLVSWDHALSELVDKLDIPGSFGHLRDAGGPVRFAVQLTRYAVAQARQERQLCDEEESIGQIISSLLDITDRGVLESEWLGKLAEHSSTKPLARDMAIAILKRLSGLGNTLKEKSRAIHLCMDILVGKWQSEMEKQDRAAELEASIFVQKSSMQHDVVQDEDQDFASLFGIEKSNQVVGGTSELEIWMLFRGIWGNSQAQSLQGLLDVADQLGSAMPRHFVLDSTLEQTTLPLATLASLSHSFDQEPSHENFYRSGNLTEKRELRETLQHFLCHAEIVQIHPELVSDRHPVLQRAADAAVAVLRMPADAPLGLLASHVEVVIQRIEEWDNRYATREMRTETVRPHLQKMVADWRRKELESWPLLFANRLKKPEERAGMWFVHVYNLIVRRCSGVLGDDLRTVLDDFLRSSSIGEFSTRLTIVRVTAELVSVLDVNSFDPFFWGLVDYYEQFSNRVLEKKQQLTSALEDKLKDMMKLLAWKRKPEERADIAADEEYYRVKSFGDRNKRKFHHLCRELDQALALPVKAVLELDLASEHQRDTEFSNSSLQELKAHGLLIKDIPEQLKPLLGKTWCSRPESLSKTLEKSSQLLRKHNVSQVAANDARDVRCALSTRVKELSLLKGKGVAAKRRGLVDLFRSLKSMGVGMTESSTPENTLLAQTWLESPRCEDKEANLLFFEGAFVVGSLRLTAPNAHSDLNQRETELMMNCSKYLFHLNTEQRRRLSEGSNAVSEIQSLSEGLAQWLGISEPVYSEVASRHKDSCKLTTAIVGMQRNVESLHKALNTATEQPITSAARHAATDARKMASVTCSLLSELLSITRNFLDNTDVRAVMFNQNRLQGRGRVAKINTGFDEAASGLRKRVTALQKTALESTTTNAVLPEIHSELALAVISRLHSLLDRHLANTKTPDDSWKCATLDSNPLAAQLIERTKALADDILTARLHCVKAFSLDEGVSSLIGEKGFRLAQKAHKRLVQCILPSVVSSARDVTKILRLMDTGKVFVDVQGLETIEYLAQTSAASLKAFVRYFGAPMLDQMVLCHREQCRLARNTMRVFNDIMSQGFCGPPPEEDTPAGDGEGETIEGMGMADVGDGDVSGAKDVTEEIEDDEQLEGLQSDPKPERTPDQKPDDCDGREMQQDFEAELEELGQDEEDDEEEEEAGSGEEETPPSEDFEDDNPEGGDEVDEKMCNEDDAKEEAGSEVENEAGIPENATDLDELAPKEEENEARPPSPTGNAQEDAPEDDKTHDLDNVDEETPVSDGDNEVTPGQKNTDHPDSAPEDMDEVSGEEGEEHEEPPQCEDNLVNEEDEEANDDRSEHDMESEGLEDADDDPTTVEKDPDADIAEEQHPVDEPLGQSTTKSGGGLGNTDEKLGESRHQNDEEDQSPLAGQQHEEGAKAETQETGNEAHTGNDHVEDSNPSSAQRVNPYQNSTEELFQAWIERLNLIKEISRGDRPDEMLGEENRQGLYEISEERVKGVDGRHLGSAEDEHQGVEQLPDCEPGEPENPVSDSADALRVGNEIESSLLPRNTEGSADKDVEMIENASEDEIEQTDSPKPKSPDEILQQQLGDHVDHIGTRGDMGEAVLTADEDQSEDEKPLKTSPGDLDCLASWSEIMESTVNGAAHLCQQLQLVLEPTVRSRLAGDFRTGKRLNMRRVVEFVASDYRKDRIWLRRVRPDKRNYDVLIAIDDSESMRDSGAGLLALEAMCLIQSALSKLEVGRIGVVRFGEVAEELHGFDDGAISEEAGNKIISQFRFMQGKTELVPALVFASQLLDDARKSTSGDSDLSQILFLISDGRMSERERIRELVRKSLERRQVIAFILVDGCSSGTTDGSEDSSILNMKRVEYKDSGMNIVPYIDDFPFPFYAIVQRVERIPEVVGEAMRQWFEIVHSQSL